MTPFEALKIAQFMSDLAMSIYKEINASPTGEVNLDHLFVKTTTQKLRDAGCDPAEADRLGKTSPKDA